jgi:hypothetical protein
MLVTAAAGAQTSTAEQMAFNRPESWALKYYASASLLTGLGPPPSLGVHLGLEADWLPAVSVAESQVGFTGQKEEELNKSFLFGRARLNIGLPVGFSIGLAYLPPIPVNGAQANLFSFSLGKSFTISDFTLGLTALGQIGNIMGDFTCPQDVLGDETKNTFGCMQRSRDVARLDYVGGEVSGAYKIQQAMGLTPYAAVHVTYMDLGFNVDAYYGGIHDTTALKTNGVTFAATGGLAFPITKWLDVSAEVFYSPLMVKRPPNTNEQNDAFINVRSMLQAKLL